jgi:L-ascorbate 6-phosphate lactonase
MQGHSMKTGPVLLRDIDATSLAPGELAFWWLGQLSFVIKVAGKVLYLDPYLSDNPARQVRPLLAPQAITHADLIFGSHDHTDHIDRAIWPALAQASPQAQFVVPAALLPKLADDLRLPHQRFVGLDDGQSIEHSGLRITGVAAAHELLDRDPATGRYPYLGYVIEADGLRVYHSGDTCKYEGLETALRRFGRCDVMFLPINGRDAKRLAGGCIGNMTYQEAVDLAGALGPRLAVAAHWDMFAGNSENPQHFVDYMKAKYPHVTPVVCQHGEAVRVTRSG